MAGAAGAGSAGAAALLTVFSRNHNHIAENVGHLNGPSGAGDDEALFQTARQGLTLAHYSAQLEPFLTQKHTFNTP
jgi:hypothetical protein